jgi:hypothetical protein
VTRIQYYSRRVDIISLSHLPNIAFMLKPLDFLLTNLQSKHCAELFIQVMGFTLGTLDLFLFYSSHPCTDTEQSTHSARRGWG